MSGFHEKRSPGGTGRDKGRQPAANPDETMGDETQRLMQQRQFYEGSTSPRYLVWLAIFAVLAIVYYFLK
jgi:hypothetical protein